MAARVAEVGVRQHESAATRRAILKAAEHLLATRGNEGVSIREVCARAGYDTVVRELKLRRAEENPTRRLTLDGCGTIASGIRSEPIRDVRDRATAGPEQTEENRAAEGLQADKNGPDVRTPVYHVDLSSPVRPFGEEVAYILHDGRAVRPE